MKPALEEQQGRFYFYWLTSQILLKVESRVKPEKEKINKKGSLSAAKLDTVAPLVPGLSSTILIILPISHYVKMAVIVLLGYLLWQGTHPGIQQEIL